MRPWGYNHVILKGVTVHTHPHDPEIHETVRIMVVQQQKVMQEFWYEQYGAQE